MVDAKLNGYQKKKYVCKLLYIYILGYPLTFGHLESLSLLTSPRYSEKQIGYLAVTLLLNERNDLINLVVNSIRRDLVEVNNELWNCMALHAIANVGGREMGEALGGDVYRLLISPTSKSFVKKKAALTLLRLYRKHPAILQPEWADRILSILDDADMGVTLSVTHLVLALLQDYPEDYRGCYPKAVRRLKQVPPKLNTIDDRWLSTAMYNQTMYTTASEYHGYKSVSSACSNTIPPQAPPIPPPF